MADLLSLLVTPPEDRSGDEMMLRDFLGRPGKKIACGGSTGRMLEGFLGRKIHIDLSSHRGTLPPAGRLKGLDLVTEGRFTLQRVLSLLMSRGNQPEKYGTTPSAAELMADRLLRAEEVEFFIGSIRHRENGITPNKKDLIGRLADYLESEGKKVTIYNY